MLFSVNTNLRWFSINTYVVQCKHLLLFSVSTPTYVAQYQHLLMLLIINTYLCCSVSTPTYVAHYQHRLMLLRINTYLCCSVSTPIYVAQCTQNSSPVCFPADWPRPGYGRVSSCHSRWARTPARSCLPSPAREQRHSEQHILTHMSTFIPAFTRRGTKTQWTTHTPAREERYTVKKTHTCTGGKIHTHTSTFIPAFTCTGTNIHSEQHVS